MKRKISMLAAALFSMALSAEPLRICPACGREDLKGVEECAFCGARLPPLRGVPPEPSPAAGRGAAAVSGALEEAAKDVAEARARRAGEPAVSLALYENALALLSADAGDAFDAKAAGKIEEELVECRKRVEDACRGSLLARLELVREGEEVASVFFRARGRLPFGRAWVPSDWPSRLPPPALAAVRHCLRPRCKACNGLGAVPCRKCKGLGKTPCDNPGCKGGWVFSKTANSLGGTGKRASTALTTRARCPVCRSTSFRACPECLGKGRTVCPKCGGDGMAPLCASCRGTGLVPCKRCARAIGKGERDKPDPACLECRGSGVVLCKKCGGDGRIRR